MSNVKAFTLIEVVIIFVVVAILTVVGLVSIKFSSDDTAELAAKKVFFDISYVREKSMLSTRSHKIYINTPDRFRAGYGNYTLIINPENNSLFDINLSKNYPGTSFFKNYSLLFDSIGRNVYGNITSIVLISSAKTKYIKIEPTTGRVYVK